MENEHDPLTPGPWRWVFLSTAGNYFLLGNNGEGPITHSAPDSADGRLKQAAPALLEALGNLVDYCDRTLFSYVHITQEPAEMKAARAAIAAARGESPQGR